MRNRLIESRLTPNAISLTGFVLNVVAAVLVWQELFVLGGIAFIVGSVCDTLDGRYSRMSGKGTPFGAFLDSTLDRIEEGIVLTAVAVVLRQARRRPRGGGGRRRRARLADGLLHARPRRGARRRVQGRHRQPRGARRDPRRPVSCSPDLGTSLAPAVYVLAGLGTITVLQRIFHVRKELNRLARPASDL